MRYDHEMETEFTVGGRDIEREVLRRKPSRIANRRVRRSCEDRILQNVSKPLPSIYGEGGEKQPYNTAKALYDYLNHQAWKQDEAKKAAAIIVYKCLRGIKDNTMFIGSTGYGKTHIWRCLKETFGEYRDILDNIACVSYLWRYPDEDVPEGKSTQPKMNPLMLLTNAIARLSIQRTALKPGGSVPAHES